MLDIIKRFFLTLVYIFFILIVVAIAGIIVIIPRISFYPPWPWWQCFALLGGVVLFCIVIWYSAKTLKRQSERKKLRAANAATDKTENTATYSLRASRKWRSMLLSLKRSCLKHRGDPLYALPWFITLGQKESGKSGLIEGSRLLFDLENSIENEEEAEGGKFWFMRDLVMIEAPADTTDTENGLSEFHVLLNQIAKNRKKEPINGIVLTLPVDMLRSSSDDELISKGRELRSQLEAIMLRFSTQIPVYIMLNKIDLIPGIRELASLLPENTLTQACGIVNEELAKPTGEFLEEAFEIIIRQLKNLRLSLIFDCSRKFPAVMATPSEVELLLQPLRVITKSLFQENPYQHTPLMRGLYLGSGNFNGEISKDHLHDIGVKCSEIETATAKNIAAKPLFLYDFFANILPKDRYFHKPLPEFMRFSALKRNTAALTLLCVGFSLILLLSAVFAKTALDYNDFRSEVIAQTINNKPTELSDAIFELNKTNELLQKLDNMRTSHWYAPLFLFFEPERLQNNLQTTFKKKFAEQVLNPLDTLINKNYPPFSKNKTGQSVGAYFEYLIRNINLARAAGSSTLREGDFNKKNPAPTPNILYIIDSGVAEDIAPMLTPLFKRYYLASNGDISLKTKSEVMTSELVTLLERGPDSLLWIIDWANTIPTIKDITLQDFWNNSFTSNPDSDKYLQSSIIPRAYTNAARVQIIGLTDELLKAINESSMDKLQAQRISAVIHNRAKVVFSIYKEQTYNAWLTFASWLTRGRLLIDNEDQLKDVAGRSAVLAGPYMNFLDKCQEELLAFAASNPAQLPPWMGLVLRVKELRTAVPFQSVLGSSASAASKAASWVSNITSQLRGNTGVGVRPTTKLRPETIFMEYCKGLWKSGPAPGSAAREVAYNNLSALYTKEKSKFAAAPKGDSGAAAGGGGDLPLDAAYTAYNDLKNNMGGASASEADNIIWEILRGPLDLVIEYNCFETGRLLESAWRSMVVNGIDTIPEVSRPTIIFKQESGRVWKWVNGPATPFLALDASGEYFPVSVFGHTIPFKTDFISMITDASKGAWGIKKTYSVNVNALPIDVNPRAKKLPNEVMLTLNTATGPTTLKNLNYPVSKKFAWNPEEGGRTQLRIDFNGMSLLRTYEGPYGFARFIKDFSDGIHTFKPTNFPDSERALDDMCVTYMDIKYFFDPGEIEPLLLLNKVLDIKVPVSISENFKDWRKNILQNNYTLYDTNNTAANAKKINANAVATNSVQSTSVQKEIEYVPTPVPALPKTTTKAATSKAATQPQPAATVPTKAAASANNTPANFPTSNKTTARRVATDPQVASLTKQQQQRRKYTQQETKLLLPPIPTRRVATAKNRNPSTDIKQRPVALRFKDMPKKAKNRISHTANPNSQLAATTVIADNDIDLNQEELDRIFAESSNIKQQAAKQNTSNLQSLAEIQQKNNSNRRTNITYNPRVSKNPFAAKRQKSKPTAIKTVSNTTKVTQKAEDADQSFQDAIQELDRFIIEQQQNDKQTY